MKNVKTKRESNFFEGIVSEEMNELSGTTRVAETNPDKMSTEHLSSEDFLYSTPKKKIKPLAKNVDSNLVGQYTFSL